MSVESRQSPLIACSHAAGDTKASLSYLHATSGRTKYRRIVSDTTIHNQNSRRPTACSHLETTLNDLSITIHGSIRRSGIEIDFPACDLRYQIANLIFDMPAR